MGDSRGVGGSSGMGSPILGSIADESRGVKGAGRGGDTPRPQPARPTFRPDHPARAFVIDSPALYLTRHAERSAIRFGVLVCLGHLAPRSVVLG